MQSKRFVPGRLQGAPGSKTVLLDPARRAFLKSGAALSPLAGGTLVPSLGTAQTPLAVPESLTADEVYAVSAYVLFLNGIVPETTGLDAKTLPQIRMPNRDGFTEDPRPDVKSKP